MKSIGKDNLKLRDELVTKLSHSHAALSEEHQTLCDAVDAFNKAIEAHNEIISEARDFANEVVGEIESFMEEKSEKWLESDRGEAYTSWKEAWEFVSFEDIDPVELPDMPDGGHEEELDGLPTEPELP